MALIFVNKNQIQIRKLLKIYILNKWNQFHIKELPSNVEVVEINEMK